MSDQTGSTSSTAVELRKHGVRCACRACTLLAVRVDPAKDHRWMHEHQSANQAPYDFRQESAMFAMRAGSIYMATEFNPELFRSLGFKDNLTPDLLFEELKCGFHAFPDFEPYRFVLSRERIIGPRQHARMIAIFTSGLCSDDDAFGLVKGAAGFNFSMPGHPNTKGCVNLTLEQEGPFGDRFQPSRDRAELRAVIAALEWRYWYREGWDALVIITNSKYVRDGACELASRWLNNEWTDKNGEMVPNVDLWKYLLMLFRLYAKHGCEMKFWLTETEENNIAIELAKEALNMFDAPEIWRKYRDVMLEQDSVFDF